jgi:hypothetical protein
MPSCDVPDFDVLELRTSPFPSSSIPKNLKLKPTELVPSLRKAIEDLLFRAIQSKNVDEYRVARDRDIAEYVVLGKAISNFIQSNVGVVVYSELIDKALISNEAFLKSRGFDVLGAVATNEALFHFVTIRKTYELIKGIIAKLKLPEHASEKMTEDRSLSKRCWSAALWVNYHYEVVLMAVAKKSPMPGDVLIEVLRGLKFSDIAYSCAKQAYLLRYPDKVPHKYYKNEHPCDHTGRGSVEEIASDAIEMYDDWAPYRERVNKLLSQ